MGRTMDASTANVSPDVTAISPRTYWHASFPRVSVTVWTVQHGTDSIDGVVGCYVNADRDTLTLVGREGAVRIGKGAKIVSVIRSTTGAAEWTHPLDTAGQMITPGA